jgi:hypothetical protein
MMGMEILPAFWSITQGLIPVPTMGGEVEMREGENRIGCCRENPLDT